MVPANFTSRCQHPILLRSLCSGVAILLASCSYNMKNQTYSQFATVTPHFSSINAGIIQVQCLPCHSSSGGAPDFTSYNNVMKRVKAGLPSSSSFYSEVASGSMPLDRPMLSDDAILAIYQWIQNGAANDKIIHKASFYNGLNYFDFHILWNGLCQCVYESCSSRLC